MRPLLFALFSLISPLAGLAQKVPQVVPGTLGVNPAHLMSFGSKKTLVFIASRPAGNDELWVWDITDSARQVYNLHSSGNGAIRHPSRAMMAMLKNEVYFSGSDNTVGVELYKWDGVSKPALVEDLNTATAKAPSNPHSYVAYGDKLFFAASTEPHKYELWEYSTNNNKATRLTDIQTSLPGTVENITIYRNKVYFVSQKKTVTTGFDTLSVFEFNPNNGLYFPIYVPKRNYIPYGLTVYGHHMYFIGAGDLGLELYALDSFGLVSKLTNIATVSGGGISPYTALLGYHNRMYFFGRPGNAGNYELMFYDIGTKKTSAVFDFGELNQTAKPLIGFNNQLYFSAETNKFPAALNAPYLYRYSGSGLPVLVDSTITSPSACIIFDGELCLAGNQKHDTVLKSSIFLFTDTANTVRNITILQNATLYPNPTGTRSTLSFHLNQTQSLSLLITDITGKTTWQKTSEKYSAGKHSIEIDTRGLPAGIYYCRLSGTDNALVWSGKLVKD